MSSKVKLKEAFDVDSKHGAFYTGGNVEWIGNTLFCQTTSSVSLVDIENGLVTTKIGDDSSEDPDVIQTFTANQENVVTSHKSGLLKLWTHDGTLKKMWKYIHKGPIARLVLNGERLVSGGSDGAVRVWDLQHQMCILGLWGCVGVVNLVEFHPTGKFIFGSGDDGKINVWSLEKGQLVKTFSGHFSKVTSIAFHYDDQHFISAGRDKVLILWSINENIAIRTVPVFEGVETVVSLPKKFSLPNNLKITEGGIFVATAGENAVVRVWDVTKSKEVFVQSNSFVSKSKNEGGLAIVKLLLEKEKKVFGVVSVDQNIILHDLKTFNCIKQFVGFTDEILDLTFLGKNDTHIAVATNSPDIKIYENSTMNCQLLKGHTDIVLALNASNANPNLLLSSAKDNTIRLWSLQTDGSMICAGIGIRHTGSVDSVVFCNLNTNFAVSASQDSCIKIWEIPQKLEENSNLLCTLTRISEQKGINCVAISPNDKIIATGSQDKKTKLWSSDTLELLGVLKGHNRGIWCVRFSPVDQVVLTASADCTIRLWSIADLNCLKKLDGHTASVYRAEFISNGLQILSASADGLIKLFNLKSSECISTLEEHEERVWTLAIKSDESGFLTGGADSLLIKWKDVTEERKLEKIKKEEEFSLQEQQLSNYIQDNKLLKALKLALHLERPFQTLNIVKSIIKKGESGLAETIGKLRDDQKEALLKCATNWNTNSRNTHPAQLVLNILINEMHMNEFHPVGLSSTIEGTLPYTERHFKRLTQMVQDLNIIKYTINCMQPHAKE